jgi:hypothetical protein
MYNISVLTSKKMSCGRRRKRVMLSIWVTDKAPLESTWKIKTKTKASKDKFVLCFPNK